MPFLTTDPAMKRARLVAAHLDGPYSVTELADRFAVPRHGDAAALQRMAD